MDNGHRRPDWMGGVVGILTFFAGVGLLLVTFNLAYGMFTVDPSKALNISAKESVDIAKTGESFVGVLSRILLLLVMSAVGSVIANRGIKLYAESRVSHTPPTAEPRETSKAA